MHRAIGFLIAVFLTILVAPNLAAQGLQGGLNLADLIGGAVDRSDTRRGLVGGGSYALLTLGPVSIGPELYYAQKGADATRLVVESPELYDEFGLEYLEVPIIARIGFRVPGVDWLGVYVQGGPAFAWNLDCTIRPGENGSAEVNDGCAFAGAGGVDSVIDKAEQGLVVGGGLALRVFNVGSVTFDGRLVRGLSRIGDPEIRNQATSLMVGYSFAGRGNDRGRPIM
jgi:hypothetical protein